MTSPTSRARTGGVGLLLAFALCAGSQVAAQSAPPPRPASPVIKALPVTVAVADAREVQRMVQTIGSLVA
jgi:hypothetical protein